MTIVDFDAGMIPSQNVEVCCANCGASYCLSGLSPKDKQWLLAGTRYQHDQEEMRAIAFIERLVESFPNTRNQLIRGKVDEQCWQLDWVLLLLNAARNTTIDHEAHRAHLRRLEERVASIRYEIDQLDSRRENASEAEEELLCQLLRDNPKIHKWLHGVFTLQQRKKQLLERIAATKNGDNSLPCRECKNGWLYIAQERYDLLSRAVGEVPT